MQFSVIFLAAASITTVPLFADQASKTKKIEEIFQLTKVDQTMTAMQAQIRGSFQSQLQAAGIPNAQAIAADMDRELTPVMNEALNWQKLKPRMLQVYDQSFTEEELNGILQFYHSPAGHAMLEKMPVLMSKSAAISQELMREAMPKIVEVSRKVMAKYKVERPAAPAAAAPKAK